MPEGQVILDISCFDVSDWVAEGPEEITRDDQGALVIRSYEGGATVWYRPMIFRNDLHAEWVASTVAPQGRNNLNFIFHAMDGPHSVLETSSARSGQYSEYHQFQNYIFTLVGDGTTGHSRLRRNPGFELLSESPDEVAQFGRTYSFSLRSQKGHLQVSIDGRLVHDVVDPKPFTMGAIGFRTWKTNLKIHALRVYDI